MSDSTDAEAAIALACQIQVPHGPHEYHRFGAWRNCQGKTNTSYFNGIIKERITESLRQDKKDTPTPPVAEVQGVGPDQPVVTNELGASQSAVPYRFDLIDAKALFKMAAVLEVGARKYKENNWRGIPINEHLNHLLMHTYAYLAGDTSDEHLSHILCRATFAQAIAEQPDGKPIKQND